MSVDSPGSDNNLQSRFNNHVKTSNLVLAYLWPLFSSKACLVDHINFINARLFSKLAPHNGSKYVENDLSVLIPKIWQSYTITAILKGGGGHLSRTESKEWCPTNTNLKVLNVNFGLTFMYSSWLNLIIITLSYAIVIHIRVVNYLFIVKHLSA